MAARTRAVHLATVLAWGMLSGCSGVVAPEGTRLPLSGHVTFRGQPLARGVILFAPAGPSWTMVLAGGPIRDGSYAIDRPHGLRPGSYRVSITAPPSGSTARGERLKSSKDLIPTRYNQNSTLAVELAPGKTTFDFNLTP